LRGLREIRTAETATRIHAKKTDGKLAFRQQKIQKYQGFASPKIRRVICSLPIPEFGLVKANTAQLRVKLARSCKPGVSQEKCLISIKNKETLIFMKRNFFKMTAIMLSLIFILTAFVNTPMAGSAASEQMGYGL